MEKKTILKFNVFAIIVITIICFAVAPIEVQNDTFYTIKIGEHIVNKGIDMQDPFSWHKGLPYTYPHWAYDVITYLIYNLSGFSGIYIATAILSIILGITLYYTNVKINKNHTVSVLTTIVMILLFKNYIAARAQLVTFILFVLTILCIEKFLETKKLKYAISLIVIPILIANIHLAVWMFYFALFLPYLCEYIIVKFYKKFINNKIENKYKIILENNKNIKWLLLIFVIAIFTGFLTPLGTTPYTYLIKTIIGTTTKGISEHLPLVLINRKELMALGIMFIGLMIFTKVKIKLRDLLMLVGLIILAIASNRQVSMLLLIGSIIIVRLIINCISQYTKEDVEKELVELCTKKLVVAGLLLVIVIIGGLLLFQKKDEKFINEKLYPVKASEWIKENLDYKNIRLFNEYNYGSYLLYEDIPVFIDSRADLYAPEFNGKKDDNGKYVGKNIFDDFISISNINVYYKYKFYSYDITHIILIKTSKLNVLINNDEDYEQIYNDNNFVIYEKIN